MQNPLLTIAICTHNRANFLDFCLDSLFHQEIKSNNFNVLVIDNASNDDTKNIAEKYKYKFENIEYIYETTPGLSRARNKAIETVTTPWLAYLDDDAKAHKNWAQIALDTIKQNVFDCFGGVYLPWYYFGPPPQWCPPQSFTNIHTQKNFGIMPDGKFPAGGNCVYNTELLRNFGGFSIEFGMNGNTIAYGEETCLIQRMREHGLRIGFVPQLLIDHCVLKYKYTMLWHIKSAYASSRDYTRIVRHKSLILYFILKDYEYYS